MTPILLLIPYLAWLVWNSGPIPTDAPSAGKCAIFLGGYAGIVLTVAIWARRLARQVDSTHLRRPLWTFNGVMLVARLVIMKWFMIGLFTRLAWGEFVIEHVPLLTHWPLSLPAAIVVTLPAYLAWMALWWAQYPADKALREQSLLAQFESDLPIYSPPRFWTYFRSNLRLQLLFTLIPLMMVLLLRDVGFLILSKAGAIAPDGSRAEPFLLLGAAAAVFLFSPIILTNILRTQPLPDSALRRRLEQICRQSNLRYRDILLWQTGGNMGNAAVMGLLPRWRYILLSDLLLESMSTEEVEAVFAHEVGHIVHRHMAWYIVLMIILMLGMSIAEVWINDSLGRISSRINVDVILNVLGAASFFLIFGFLSRRFERQADVYAARTMQNQRPESAGVGTGAPAVDHVGPYGADLFAAALHRVAVVNNIPISVRGRFEGRARDRFLFLLESALSMFNNWRHGSIASRMNYVKNLALDPKRTDAFDRFMIGVYATMLMALIVFGSFAWVYRDKLL